nr:FUSC family protein [Clostridium sp. 1001275B_160808_H3]
MKETWRIPKATHKIRGIRYNLKLDKFQLRFALRLSFVITATFLISKLTGLNHSYWIPMNAFFMITPFYEDSAQRINNRILGTIIGSILAFILLSIFKTPNSHIVIIVIMTICMYSATPSTWIMTSYSTCYGLALVTLAMDRTEAIELRLVYIFIAAIISILASKYILPNKSSYEFKLNVNKLIEIDRRMVSMLRKALENKDEFDNTYLRELLIRSNQINLDIKNYKKKNEYEQSFYNNLLEINKQLIHEVRQISYIAINNEGILQEDKNINEVLDNIEVILNIIQVTLESNELAVNQIMSRKSKDYGLISKDLYFNSIVLNCMNTAEDMYKLVSERYKEHTR